MALNGNEDITSQGFLSWGHYPGLSGLVQCDHWGSYKTGVMQRVRRKF